MSLYRQRLNALPDRLYMTDGGLETTLLFHDRIELPAFASFVLLAEEGGRNRLWDYYQRYLTIGLAHGLGAVLETPTWRANPDWGAKLGYDAAALATVNRQAVELLAELRDRHPGSGAPMLISGNLGPRGDGYRPDARMDAAEAEAYHGPQIRSFAASAADLVSAFTLNYVDEAVGIARAARNAGMPLVLAFTVETDGRLPTGESLAEAITTTDERTGGYAAWYMVNCAHPSHFGPALAADGVWRHRIRGIRANASRLSHAELDECTSLDSGDPLELAAEYRALRQWLPELAVVGGCCGTDHRHVAAICAALAEPDAGARPAPRADGTRTAAAA